MATIRQIVKYEFNGKEYDSYELAESAALDLFGEEMDSIFQESGGTFRFRQEAIDIVTNAWAKRTHLASLLSVGYAPHPLCQTESDE